ncbi:hypothetical protein HDU76_011659 [Blyttiomyces sp. JEL0837]|nr:hypothetical protein HDU76_011659 [Blyttiomyces sp. JEL0837]
MADVLGPQITKGLNDKLYEKRKVAALEVERIVREAQLAKDGDRINRILAVLIQDFAYSVAANARNGGLIALAAASIALGSVDLIQHLDIIIPPILACFADPDSRVRYYACESMYNVAKVARAEILKFFNEIFDAMSKLAADNDNSVKTGAELLDRLIKDIVCERSTYYPQEGEMDGEALGLTEDGMKSLNIRTPSPAPGAFNSPKDPSSLGPSTAAGGQNLSVPDTQQLPKYPADPAMPPAPGSSPLLPGMTPSTFNLPRFIPLLTERIRVINPSTRMFLVQWILTLDSVPFIELVGYLPDFLDGLFIYLSDPNVDLRVATSNCLGEFLKEIHEVVEVQRERGVFHIRGKRGSGLDGLGLSYDGIDDRKRQASLPPYTEEEGDDIDSSKSANAKPGPNEAGQDGNQQSGAGATTSPPTSAVVISPPAVSPSDGQNDDSLMHRAASSLSMASAFYANGGRIAANKGTVNAVADESLPYVPGQNVILDIGRMVDILVPHLTSSDEETQATALRWINEFILLVKEVMLPFVPTLISAILPSIAHTVDPIRTMAVETNANLYKLVLDAPPAAGVGSGGEIVQTGPGAAGVHGHPALQPGISLTTVSDMSASISSTSSLPVEPFDIQATVETLTLQFQDESEETRVASMDWLLMLHKKAPKKILTSDDSTFHALLRTLSDSSEEVVKRDLQLLAQISQYSDDDYFMRFMVNLLSLFSTDRRLLETRGALIIRQLCLSLNPERMYRAFAEILERDEDLDFASTMVQNLNIILITAPELAELRRRLKNLETRDGLLLFAVLYRSWCHNPVATFSLCLLAQAYEHAANLLQVFAELEITVNFLIQVDKLVQLIESPVFTYLRLQLLEPDKYPHLFRCLYGILMLLPQSSAFATLRNRLNSVSSMVMLYGMSGPLGGGVGGQPGSSSPMAAGVPKNRPKSVSGVNQSAPEPLTLRWHELLTHFRSVQSRHERYRRMGNRGGFGADRNPSTSKRRSRSSRMDEDPNSTFDSLNRPMTPQNGMPSPGIGGGNTSSASLTAAGGLSVKRDRQPSLSSLKDLEVGSTSGGGGTGMSGRASVEGLDRVGGGNGVGGNGVTGVGANRATRALSGSSGSTAAAPAAPPPKEAPKGIRKVVGVGFGTRK